jgi:hypothetical protein
MIIELYEKNKLVDDTSISILMNLKTLNMNVFLRFLLSLFLFSFGTKGFATACCGSGASFPSLITEAVRTQFNFTIGRSNLLGKKLSSNNSIEWALPNKNKTQKLTLEGAYLFDNFVQVGLTIPYFFKQDHNRRISQTAQHLGDIGILGAYEFLPESSYSPWSPRGIIFSEVILPTGKSFYHSSTVNPINISGKGFYTFSSGLVLIKVKGAWDAQFLFEGHYGLKKSFLNQGPEIRPGWGTSALLAIGYDPRQNQWRWGVSLAPHFESSKTLSYKFRKIKTGHELYWDASFNASYLYSPKTSFTFSITDQTLFGPIHNTTLSKTFSLGLQKRWPL